MDLKTRQDPEMTEVMLLLLLCIVGSLETGLYANNSSIHFLPLIQLWDTGIEPIPAVIGLKAGYTLKRLIARLDLKQEEKY